MASSPIVTVNLWFDRQVLDEPFVGLPGRSMQWVFDKRLMLGGSTSHVSLVSSGASPLLDRQNDEIIAAAYDELLAALPETRGVRAAARVGHARAARDLLAGAGTAAASGTRTGVPGLYLAGDWIETGLPATIESAVRSGHRAADAVLADA